MGSSKDLNNPAVYAEALVRATLFQDREKLAAWLAEEDTVADHAFQKWYLYFADRLLDLSPKPELGFIARPKRVTPVPKIGRNDVCPCGSEKKYKQCHLGQDDVVAWKIGSPTPAIRAMAVAQIVHELPLQVLDMVPRDLASPVALTEMATAYHRHQRLDDAVELLSTVLSGDREDPHMLYDYWIARYAEWLVEADRAEMGEKFLLNEYDSPLKVEAWQVAQKLAAFYVDQGDTENAKIWVDTALEGDGENPFNHYLKGMLFHFDEEWEGAETYYQNAMTFSNRFREEEREYMGKLVEDALIRAQNHQSLEEDELEEDELEEDELEESVENKQETIQ